MPTTEQNTIKNFTFHDVPFSFAHVKKVTPLNSELAGFLKTMATEDVWYKRWDFDENTSLDGFWRVNADAGAVPFEVPAVAQAGGWLVGSTGATDNAGLSLHGPKAFKGDKRCWLHVHFQLDVVTNVSFEIGFVDYLDDFTLPAISDIDTPAVANGCGDACGVHMDTDQTLTTMAAFADSSLTGVTQKLNIGTLAPTAATTMCVKVALDVNDVMVEVNSKRSYRKHFKSGIEGGTLLRPWIYFRTRSTAAKAPKIDFIEMAVER